MSMPARRDPVMQNVLVAPNQLNFQSHIWDQFRPTTKNVSSTSLITAIKSVSMVSVGLSVFKACVQDTICSSSFCSYVLRSKSPPSARDSHNWGEEELFKCVFPAHVKLSKVFHWAGLSDTLPKDLHSGRREGLLSNSFPAAAVMGSLIPVVVATEEERKTSNQCLTN